MAIKEYSIFPQAPAFISWTLVEGGGLLLCGEAVSVFYNPSLQGNQLTEQLSLKVAVSIVTMLYDNLQILI